MLRLNNELLTIEGMITSFEKNVFDKTEPGLRTGFRTLLFQFKNKLKSIYFENMDKIAIDLSVVAALEDDSRFVDYPELKAALHVIFSSNDATDKAEILERLKVCCALRLNTEDRIQAQWVELNARLGYFNERPDLFLLFNQLASACRAMIILIEQNNAPDDTMAYTYAYRLMALWVDPTKSLTPDFASIEKHTKELIRRVAASTKNKPYHDVLLNRVSLPIARDVRDMPGWRQFIAKHEKSNMPSALRFFAMAPAIENQIKEEKKDYLAPKTLVEASNMAVRCYFKRGAENRELAALCREWNVPEDNDECSFNKCLDYLATLDKWPVKSGDSLPHLEIKGEGSAAGYFWVKLPTNDLRALILGRVTGSCQSIGGHSEQCVKDAIELPDNGLYLLLKLKPKKPPASRPVAPDQSINYSLFEIVGESYGWISKAGNLTLDSLECSVDRVPTHVAQAMLATFAEKVLETNPVIKRITIGSGGGTPASLFPHKTRIPEKIRHGVFYGDASQQYLIAQRPSRLTETQQQALQQYLQPFRESILYLCDYLLDTIDVTNQIALLVKQYPVLQDSFSQNELFRLLRFSPQPTLDDLVPIDWKVLTPELSDGRLMWQADTLEKIMLALPCLRAENRLAAVKEKDAYGNSTLHMAASHFESLKVILALYPELERLAAVEKKESAGNTVLHLAASYPESLKTILALYLEYERLAAVKKKNMVGRTALHFAASHFESFNVILTLYPEFERLAAVKEKDDHGNNVLCFAAGNNSESLKTILALYLESDRLAAVKEKDNYGYTLLHHAARHPESLKTILALYPESERLVAVKEEDLSGRTVLHLSAKNPESITAILVLLPESERLASVKEMDSNGYTVLHVAVRHPESFNAILALLPESDRFAAMKEEGCDGTQEDGEVFSDQVRMLR